MGTHPIFESDFDCLTDLVRKMESPPGCTSSEEEDATKKPLILSESSDLLTPEQKKSRRRRKRVRNRNRPGTRNVSFDEEATGTASPFIPHSKVEKRAYRAECINRPRIPAPANTGSFIADNNSSDGESELKEMGINEDFDRDYHSRLNDEIQGERERSTHEENVAKRQDQLKGRLESANLEISKLKESEFKLQNENETLRSRVNELEGEVAKLRKMNRNYVSRQRSQR